MFRRVFVAFALIGALAAPIPSYSAVSQKKQTATKTQKKADKADGKADKSGTPPKGATAQCRDGTYSYSKHRSGTCSHHGGVKTWLAPEK